MSGPDYMDDDRPPHPFDYISPDAVQDLWGIGYTIVKRPGGPDPFRVPPEMVPQGRAYQWWHLVHDKFHFHREGDGSSGWAPVPASRHDGYFMPFGHQGNIEVGGLGLFEKPKVEVDQELASNATAAKKQVDDWIEEAVKDGLSGTFSVGGLTTDIKHGPSDTFLRSDTKTIETAVKVPKDMVPYMREIFAERDRLEKEVVNPDRTLNPGPIADRLWEEMEDPGKEWWPTLRAILLPIAIRNVRNALNEEK